jgi:hypothetical protein
MSHSVSMEFRPDEVTEAITVSVVKAMAAER